jgi:hypothetical protein
MPLRRFKKIRRDWYGIKHISLWPLLMLLIYWMKHKYQKKNTGGLLDASEEVVPELSHSKLGILFMSCCQNTGEICDKK